MLRTSRISNWACTFQDPTGIKLGELLVHYEIFTVQVQNSKILWQQTNHNCASRTMRCWGEPQTYSAESWGRWGGWCWSLWCTHRSGSCSPGSGPAWGTDTQRCPASQHKQLTFPLPPFLTKTLLKCNFKRRIFHHIFIFPANILQELLHFPRGSLPISQTPQYGLHLQIPTVPTGPSFFCGTKHPEDEAEGSYLAYGNNFHRESAFVVVNIAVNVVGDQTLGWFGSVNENTSFQQTNLEQKILGTK